MTALALPVLGVLFVFGVVLPTAALCARVALRWLHARAPHTALHGYGAWRYSLLIGPTFLPLAWLVSACLHQAETGTHPSVCAMPDAPGVLCPEVAWFASAITLLVALTALPRLIREQRALRSSSSVGARKARARLQRLLASEDTAALHHVIARAVIVDGAQNAIATSGVFAPRVIIDAAFIQTLDDESLRAALCHELEHVRDRDPLRYFLAWWALAINPIGRWLLEHELARWIVTREVHCDREAVLTGASAPALAQALVTAARFPSLATLQPRVALGDCDAGVLRLRVELLLAYSECRPEHCCRTPALRGAVCALLLALACPHQFGVGPLDSLHRATELAAAFVGSME